MLICLDLLPCPLCLLDGPRTMLDVRSIPIRESSVVNSEHAIKFGCPIQGEARSGSEMQEEGNEMLVEAQRTFEGKRSKYLDKLLVRTTTLLDFPQLVCSTY